MTLNVHVGQRTDALCACARWTKRFWGRDPWAGTVQGCRTAVQQCPTVCQVSLLNSPRSDYPCAHVESHSMVCVLPRQSSHDARGGALCRRAVRGGGQRQRDGWRRMVPGDVDPQSYTGELYLSAQAVEQRTPAEGTPVPFVFLTRRYVQTLCLYPYRYPPMPVSK